MSTIELSYIISTYGAKSVENLPVILYALRVQTHRKFEIIVTDNSEDLHDAVEIESICRGIDPKIRYFNCRKDSCYASADFGAEKARGEFICFPSDDTYYMPTFGATMLAASVTADFVYCDIVYDPRCGHGRYHDTDVRPCIGWIDKTQFIVRKSVFPGFMVNQGEHAAAISDGMVAEEMVRRGVSHKKIPDVLGVHN